MHPQGTGSISATYLWVEPHGSTTLTLDPKVAASLVPNCVNTTAPIAIGTLLFGCLTKEIQISYF